MQQSQPTRNKNTWKISSWPLLNVTAWSRFKWIRKITMGKFWALWHFKNAHLKPMKTTLLSRAQMYLKKFGQCANLVTPWHRLKPLLHCILHCSSVHILLPGCRQVDHRPPPVVRPDWPVHATAVDHGHGRPAAGTAARNPDLDRSQKKWKLKIVLFKRNFCDFHVFFYFYGILFSSNKF